MVREKCFGFVLLPNHNGCHSKSYLIFRKPISAKWRMKFVCTISSDTANIKKNAKENIFCDECEHLHECSNIKSCEKRHSKRCKKNNPVETPANLNMTVLTLIESQLKVKRRIC